MESLALLLVVGLLVGLLFRRQATRDRLTDLEHRVGELHADVRWLRAQLEELMRAGRAGPTTAPPVEPRPVPPPVPAVEPEPVVPVAVPTEPFDVSEPEPEMPEPAVLQHEEAEREIGEPVGAATAPAASRVRGLNWEQFMGVKLFAWLGGFALFLGVAFFVKYSFEHDLVPPEARVALGFLVGLGLVAGGVRLSSRPYAVTAQTLCGTGIVTLYAVIYAAHAVYRFPHFGLVPTFLLMSLVTATAFLLAARLTALLVAVLGMLGGFLTPMLLSTGEDNPVALFGYVALLDAGLVAVVASRGWTGLVTAAAAGTVLTQIGWAATFFTVAKMWSAVLIFGSFDAGFVAAAAWAGRRHPREPWLPAAAMLGPFASLVFALFCIQRFATLATEPAGVLTLVLVADLCLLLLVCLREELASLQLVAGLAAFGILAVWTRAWLTLDILDWALGAILGFAVLHSAFPVVLPRIRPGARTPWWAQLFPPLALALVTLLIATRTVSLLVWPVVLLIDLLAIALAVVTASLLLVGAALVLTVATTGLWVLRVPPEATALPAMLAVIGGFAALFLLASLFLGRALAGRLGDAASRRAAGPGGSREPAVSPDLAAQLPVVSAVLPFLLLILVTGRLPLADPSPVFGLALLLSGLLLGLARAFRLGWLPAVGLGSVLALEHAWHLHAFRVDGAAVALGWYLGFYALFMAFPFLVRGEHGTVAWATAALSGPLHFFLVHRVVAAAYPNPSMGLLPLAFALPALAGLAARARSRPGAGRTRLDELAWFGGSALFFVTLAFPLQLERQWLTLGWALEGTALLWLFRRLPHPGLPLVGVGLLGVVFVRLALNPAVLAYHPRSATPILNWYLYAYGLASLCLFAGACLLAPPRHRVLGVNVPPVLGGLGVVLLFLLVNIEIADYFGETGAVLTFEFGRNLARDMTYSLAWAAFALGLLVVGIARGWPGARYAGLGLLGITLVKLFLHDLGRLGQLYRVGALVGVAVIAILASFLYQRYLAAGTGREDAPPPPAPPR